MRQITYHIHRYQQGRAFVQTFKFDYEPDRTILWGLQKIKDTQDPTLTFLAACRSAVCGACSIRVNGEAMLGCEAKIDELTERYGTDGQESLLPEMPGRDLPVQSRQMHRSFRRKLRREV